MYLSLTPTSLCEPLLLHRPTRTGDSGAKRILAPFLELVPTTSQLTTIGHSGPGPSTVLSRLQDFTVVGTQVLAPEIQQRTLLFLLSNPLLLSLTADHLSPSSTLNLAAASRAFQSLIRYTPGVFRRLDLTEIRSARFDIDPIDRRAEAWRNVQLDENSTEDEFYSGPLRGIFSILHRQHFLRGVSILILDGLSVTAELVDEIITNPSFSVRILSLRDVKNLSQPKLRATLQVAVRPSRAEGTPRLKGLYIFGDKNLPSLPAANTAAFDHGGSPLAAGWSHRSHHNSLFEALHHPCDFWYDQKGTMLPRPVPMDWASTMLACAGLISFDAVLCRGPRHFNSPAFGHVNIGPNDPPSPEVPSRWAVATHALDACAGCGSAPEGWTIWGESIGIGADDDTCRFPLLAPLPVHCSNTRVACCPTGAEVKPLRAARLNSNGPRRFIARCMECLRNRYCWGCNKWWCEKCYVPVQMDQHDNGLSYKVRDGLCEECMRVDDALFDGHDSIAPSSEP